jgi:hypothetical protein
MAMRWSPWVVTMRAAHAVIGPPANDEALGLFLDIDAAGRRPGGHQGDAVALLDPHLADAAHDRLARGEGGGDGQDRIFVDHRRARARAAPRRPSAPNGGR